MSPAFTDSYIIAGLVYEHTTVEPVVIQKLDEKNTLLVFMESEDIEKICSTLQSIEMWLGHSVNIGSDITKPQQVSMRDQLYWVGREEIMSAVGTNTHLYRQIPEPQYDISCPSVASQVVGKTPKFTIFSRDTTQKEGGLISAICICSEECDAKLNRGDIEGGNNMVITWNHG